MLKNRKAQSTLEYTVLLIIAMGVLLTISSYFKRGLQGRWKTVSDGLGDQYDPRYTEGVTTHIMESNSQSMVVAIPEEDGVWTQRTDTTSSIENTIGNVTTHTY